MISRIRAYIEEKQMIQPKDHILVGISGGADSVCLLLVLLALRNELDFEVSCVHVNHGLRGGEAKRDEEYVKKLCRDRATALSVYECPVKERAEEEKISLEEAGRLFRYEVFAREARERGCNKIAVAHHGNDQAETMLFHLFRGTGLKGLAGMEPVRGQIIRPLLCVERKEIQDWLEARGISWCTDSTNLEDDYTRNRIRHTVLECAEKEINAKAVSHMMQTAEELAELEAFLEEETEKAFRLYVRTDEKECFVFGEAFERLSQVLLRRLLRKCLGQLGGLKDVERQHVRFLQELMEKQTGRILDLPGGRKAQKDYNGLRIFKESCGSRTEMAGVICPEFPGTYVINGLVWQISFENQEFLQGIPEKTYTKWFDYDKIEQCLEIRRRKPGDYLEINREHGRKKLKDYLIDRKIPAREREKLMLLADGNHILWIPGERISEKYKVTGTTKKILKVQIHGGKENG